MRRNHEFLIIYTYFSFEDNPQQSSGNGNCPSELDLQNTDLGSWGDLNSIKQRLSKLHSCQRVHSLEITQLLCPLGVI
jgi:hypothetical protein